MDPKINDPNWLSDQYIRLNKSTTTIAKEVGCSPALISNKLRKFNIPSRSISEAISLQSDKISRETMERWRDPMFRQLVSNKIRETINNNPAIKESMVAGSINYWADPHNKLMASKQTSGKKRQPHSQETKDKLSQTTKLAWANQDYRNKVSRKISLSITEAIQNGTFEINTTTIHGWYNSPKVGPIYLKSGWEIELAKVLDLSMYTWGYETERLTYEYDGIKHFYIPDFIVSTNHGKVIIEVKKSNWNNNARETAKISTARMHFTDFRLVDSKSKLDNMIKIIKSSNL